MKLIIQIPCFNEEQTLPTTLADLPREVPGFEVVEWLVVDDGSTDRTAEVAREHGVDHVVRHTHNHGLARAFMTGIDFGLKAGAHVIVNTDADNQYRGADIPRLVGPILANLADIVVGARPIDSVEHFSSLKKLLQKLGSGVVRLASGTDIADAPSGFRAIGREAAMRTLVFNPYTYTLETIIQAGRNDMRILSVPIGVNRDLRPSRLVKSIPSYVKRSVLTILRIFVLYKPMRFFGGTGLVSALIGTMIGVRFVLYWSMGNGSGHIQSLILAAILIILGSVLVLMGFVCDLIAANRRLLEDIRYRELSREMASVQRERSYVS